MKRLLVLVAAVIGFASVSNADLMVEPYLGYEMAKVSFGGLDSKPSGTALGLRLAYKIPFFWFGFDGSTASGKVNPEASGATNSDYTRTTLGVVAGVNFPILFRAWVGYGLSNKLTEKNSSSDFTGTNTKIGVGFTGLPFVSLNLEMITDNFDKLNSNSISGLNSSSYLLSVSLPLSF